tara:strand:- start:193 stop:453 length:261 start_codon:yes stop_codon:yes gene_type:complete
MKNTLTVLVDLLLERAELPDSKQSEYLTFRFLDAGIIDSFNLMQFIMEIEEEFDIELTPDDTQSEEFRTLGGLALIIDSKKQQDEE